MYVAIVGSVFNRSLPHFNKAMIRFVGPSLPTGPTVYLIDVT